MKSEIKLKLLIFIVSEDQSDRLQSLLDERELRAQVAAFAEGTARSEYLSLWGLNGPEKSLHYAVGEGDTMARILEEISAEMQFSKPGSGIGMLLPLSAVCSKKTFDYLLGGFKHGNDA